MKTAHQINKLLFKAASVKEEYTADCLLLRDKTQKFSCDFLDSCRTLWEARRLLCGSNYIENALMSKDKRFLAHPFCQEIIQEEFYGRIDFKKFTTKLYLTGRALLTAMLVLFNTFWMMGSFIRAPKKWQYQYSRLDYLCKDLLVPFNSFICDVINYLVLLGKFRITWY